MELTTTSSSSGSTARTAVHHATNPGGGDGRGLGLNAKGLPPQSTFNKGPDLSVATRDGKIPGPVSETPTTTHTTPRPKPKPKLFNFQERLAATELSAERHASTPDNLFSRKAWVGIVLGLIGWAYYVFVGRLCVPLIRSRRGGEEAQGIGLLVGFNVLWLMFVWTYLKMILTGPGTASSRISQTDGHPPGGWSDPSSSHQLPTSRPPDREIKYYPGYLALGLGNGIELYSGIGGGGRKGQGHATVAAADEGFSGELGGGTGLQYLGTGSVPPPPAAASHDSREYTRMLGESGTVVRDDNAPREDRQSLSRLTLPGGESYQAGYPDLHRADGAQCDFGAEEGMDLNAEPERGVLDGPMDLLPIGLTAAFNPMPLNTHAPSNPHPTTTFHSFTPANPLHHRPLAPHRIGLAYCDHCERFKPDRTHHCRHCGTCVSGMDHHCPWVGQCVGWGNHKFFIIFCGWSTLFTAYVLAVFAAKLGSLDSVDGQIIALICVSALFTSFTSTMFTSHVLMAMTALTTIESYAVRSQEEREQHLLSERIGFWAWGEKRRIKRRWRDEYGPLRREGNRWWIGGRSREWTEVMGDSVFGWILPIGRPKGDGRNFQQNPRFTADGMRRPRDEWPEEMR